MNRCVDDNAIKHLTKLQYLDAFNNPNITTVQPFASTLTELNASIHCGIGDIKDAKNIKILIANNNRHITEPFGESLIELDAKYSQISDNGLKRAVNLKILDASFNPNITTIVPFKDTLTSLDASGTCGISDTTLVHTTKLKYLYASENPKITSVKSFANTLTVLHARGNCGIDDKALEHAKFLENLDTSGNRKIKTITPFADTLVHLCANENCGITTKNLMLAKNLRYLEVACNNKITVKKIIENKEGRNIVIKTFEGRIH